MAKESFLLTFGILTLLCERKYRRLDLECKHFVVKAAFWVGYFMFSDGECGRVWHYP